jgi:hypothetical protein
MSLIFGYDDLVLQFILCSLEFETTKPSSISQLDYWDMKLI